MNCLMSNLHDEDELRRQYPAYIAVYERVRLQCVRENRERREYCRRNIDQIVFHPKSGMLLKDIRRIIIPIKIFKEYILQFTLEIKDKLVVKSRKHLTTTELAATASTRPGVHKISV